MSIHESLNIGVLNPREAWLKHKWLIGAYYKRPEKLYPVYGNQSSIRALPVKIRRAELDPLERNKLRVQADKYAEKYQDAIGRFQSKLLAELFQPGFKVFYDQTVLDDRFSGNSQWMRQFRVKKKIVEASSHDDWLYVVLSDAGEWDRSVKQVGVSLKTFPPTALECTEKYGTRLSFNGAWYYRGDGEFPGIGVRIDRETVIEHAFVFPDCNLINLNARGLDYRISLI